jgi:hypothetical protein
MCRLANNYSAVTVPYHTCTVLYGTITVRYGTSVAFAAPLIIKSSANGGLPYGTVPYLINSHALVKHDLENRFATVILKAACIFLVGEHAEKNTVLGYL